MKVTKIIVLDEVVNDLYAYEDKIEDWTWVKNNLR